MKYAFWQYDLFPYLLWSRVVKLDEKNKKAEVVGYGGATFNYVKVLDEEEALKVIEEINGVVHRRNESLALTNKLSAMALDKIAPWRK